MSFYSCQILIKPWIEVHWSKNSRTEFNHKVPGDYSLLTLNLKHFTFSVVYFLLIEEPT